MIKHSLGGLADMSMPCMHTIFLICMLTSSFGSKIAS
ncbi:hypothetical protein CP8484711_0669, partial [Chlamydia psittaci 84-8471/1]